MLLRAGEVPPTVWFLRRGQVTLGAATEEGTEAGLAVREPPALFGIEALVGEPSPHDVIALTEVVLCAVDTASFRAWVGPLETPAGAVLGLQCRETIQRSFERTTLEGHAVRRVARLLSVQAWRPDGRLEVPQRVLARSLAMRPETFSRAVARLREVGALARGRGVRLARVEVLERVAAE